MAAGLRRPDQSRNPRSFRASFRSILSPIHLFPNILWGQPDCPKGKTAWGAKRPHHPRRRAKSRRRDKSLAAAKPLRLKTVLTYPRAGVKKQLLSTRNTWKNNEKRKLSSVDTHPALTRSRQAWRRGSVYPEGCSRPLKTSSTAAWNAAPWNEGAIGR